MKNKQNTDTNDNAATDNATTEAAKPKRGRPAGSKNKRTNKLTEVSVAYLVEKYGNEATVPVSTQWIEDQARALIQAEVAAAAASAISPFDSEEEETKAAVEVTSQKL